MAGTDHRLQARIATAGVLTIALLVFLLPIPADSTTARLAMRLFGLDEGTTVIVGNSVIDHVSNCDKDKRGIAEMLAVDSGRPVRDLSNGGQDARISLGLAALALSRAEVTQVILPISLEYLSARARLDLRTQTFFHLLEPQLASYSPWQRTSLLEPIGDDPSFQKSPFVYRGRHFEGYAEISSGYFTHQRSAMGCPEGLGSDRQMIEALYWNANARGLVDDALVTDIAALARSATQRGKSLIPVMMPFNAQDVRAFRPALEQEIAVRRVAVVAALRREGLNVIDLGDSLPPDLFADRWCACGHLQAKGRRIVAQSLAAKLS